MRDEMDGRLWAEHHRDLTDLIHKGVEAIRVAFCALHKIQFDAPWNTQKQC